MFSAETRRDDRSLMQDDAIRTLIDDGPVCVIVWRREAEWRVSHVTANAEAVLGHPAADLLSGQIDYASIIHEQDGPALFERIGLAATGGACDLTLLYRIVTPSGEERRIYDRTRILRDADGEPEAFVSYVLDATEDPRDEAGRDYVAHMSHEIRTPLSGMLGLIEALDANRLPPEQAEIVASLRESAQSLTQLVSNVLDLSKIAAGAMELDMADFRLGELCAGAERLFSRRAAAKGVALTAEGQAQDLTLRGDPGRLRQLVYNLVSNAVKFTDRGAVTIRWRTEEPRADGRVLVRLEVADTGVGMTSEAVRYVFESYRQADARTGSEHGGTGLGLAIAKQLAALMGGRLSVESRLGEGSTFFFEAPFEVSTVSQSDLAALEREEANAAARGLIQARRPRVLAAEDAAANQRVLELLLTPLGATVEIARDGREAVEAFQTRPFDLVLMDSRMPRLGGVEATAEIRRIEREAARPRTPILALTAETADRTLRAFEAAEVDGVLPKPFDPQRLYREIAALLGEARPGDASGDFR